MSFGGVGFSEMLVIAVIVLVFFGPRRMPEIGRAVGGALREFRRGMNEIQRELQEAERSLSVEPEKQRGATATPPSSSSPAAASSAPPDSDSEAPPDSDSEAKPDAMGN